MGRTSRVGSMHAESYSVADGRARSLGIRLNLSPWCSAAIYSPREHPFGNGPGEHCRRRIGIRSGCGDCWVELDYLPYGSYYHCAGEVIGEACDVGTISIHTKSDVYRTHSCLSGRSGTAETNLAGSRFAFDPRLPQLDCDPC